MVHGPSSRRLLVLHCVAQGNPRHSAVRHFVVVPHQDHNATGFVHRPHPSRHPGQRAGSPGPLPRFALGASHGQSPHCPAPAHRRPHVACGGGAAPAARPPQRVPSCTRSSRPRPTSEGGAGGPYPPNGGPTTEGGYSPTLPRSLVPPIPPCRSRGVAFTLRRCPPPLAMLRFATAPVHAANTAAVPNALLAQRSSRSPLLKPSTPTNHTALPVRARPSHHHRTRANTPLRHVAAAARSHLLKDARSPSVPSHHPCAPPLQHYAFHGNAFNPDASKIAEYRERSQCSEGPLWQGSNADEISQLAQGYGAVKDTNTMFLIPKSAIPQNCKPTYLRVVSAFRPKKANPRRVC